MKNTIKKLLTGAVVSAAGLALISCDVDKKSEGKLPSVDVDVDAEGGKLPEYEVKTPEVKTGTKTIEVEVPTVEVEPAEDGDDN